MQHKSDENHGSGCATKTKTLKINDKQRTRIFK